MRYIAQIMAVLNWLHERRWRWIFGEDGEKENGQYNAGCDCGR